MDEDYDVIVCGTGLKECVLSGLLSVAKKKVLHLDRNGYYGGDTASLNLTNLWKKFKPNEEPPKEYGMNRDWNVDLVPKFVMASGNLVKILTKTGVSRYAEWHVIEGTYVYQHQKGGFFSSEKFIHKVPATEKETIKSSLMSLLEKRRCASFFQFCSKWNENDPATHNGVSPTGHTMKQLFDSYGLEQNTMEFIGHAVALYTNDDYLEKPCGPTLGKIKLYMESFLRFSSSPFIYPMYGQGTIPEGFSRLCAIHGGTYMLNKPVSGFEIGSDGYVTVKSGNESAKAKIVICDPSYVLESHPHKVRRVGEVIRCICILGGPIPDTKNVASCQIIIPSTQLNRKNDVFVTMVSSQHKVAKDGKHVAIVSTIVETNNPKQEILPAVQLLGTIEHYFIDQCVLYEPTDAGQDGLHVTSSYDALSHFESATDDALRVYEQIMGAPLDLSQEQVPQTEDD